MSCSNSFWGRNPGTEQQIIRFPVLTISVSATAASLPRAPRRLVRPVFAAAIFLFNNLRAKTCFMHTDEPDIGSIKKSAVFRNNESNRDGGAVSSPVYATFELPDDTVFEGNSLRNVSALRPPSLCDALLYVGVQHILKTLESLSLIHRSQPCFISVELFSKLHGAKHA